ncbi:hypothetical protein ACFYW6_38365 [Streptomyces sp. NPDC002659]
METNIKELDRLSVSQASGEDDAYPTMMVGEYPTMMVGEYPTMMVGAT